MTSLFKQAMIGLATFAALQASAASAQEDTTRNIAEVECKTVMRLADSEQEATIAFLHGYIAGTKGELVVDLAKLSAATDKFIDRCLDNPRDKAVTVMTGVVE